MVQQIKDTSLSNGRVPVSDSYSVISKNKTPGEAKGYFVKDQTNGSLSSPESFNTVITETHMDETEPITYPSSPNSWRELNEREKASIGTPNIEVDESVLTGATQRTAWQNPGKKQEMLDNIQSNIQNDKSFPSKLSGPSGMLSAKYDYRIIPGDDRYKKTTSKLENDLMRARAALGLQVHGNNNIGRNVKYYMYNRFKVPDQNLAFNKMTTHVFFTRPDLNLLTCRNGHPGVANSQVMGHTDSAMLWRMNPTLFKLLTTGSRCGDSNNFNLLLSQQVSSWDIPEDELQTQEVGKSWNGFTISYGKNHSGKQGGVVNCNFNELQDLSIINMMRLWITYIDNVSSGAWSPSYNLDEGSGINTKNHRASHVYMKELDYAASAYVFKCGPDGETVLYWEKYYGIFPTRTGANALSWDESSNIGTSLKLSIPFKYSIREPMDPISLIEFNLASGIDMKDSFKATDVITSQRSYNANYNHSARPFVGAPFIEFSFPKNTELIPLGVNYVSQSAQIRLKFKKPDDSRMTDSILYKYDIDGSKILT